ncbi:MAG: hypothetical protein HYX28_04785 [Candidatus Koribacter versatilis]|uniref:Uncharacterized protein n=1 Tax=Candidatus Korobacter versatilis TaxID=658062 RepID=A0A932EPF6_9BACT|nr:hypothetical protein [Candidatus Koribacter versatilis]
MSLDGLYYQHSGKYSVTGALYAVVVGSVIACACAFVYAYIIVYCPIVYLNALIALGFGAVIGYMCAAMLKQKKVRSDAVAVGITLVVTTVAYYFHWAVWVWALARRGEEPVPFIGLVGLTIFPKLLWEALRAINVEGAWTLRGSAVSGVALWIVWASELAAIYWCSLKTAFSHMDEHPFCETCEEWGVPDPSVLTVNTGDVAELKRRAEAKDLRYIEELGGPKDGSDFTRMDLFSCQRCGSLYTMDMERVQVTASGGKSKEKKSRVLHHLLLSPSEAQSIKKLAEKLKPAALDVPPDTTKAEGASA